MVELKNLVLSGIFEEPLPDECPAGFEASPHFPGWTRVIDDATTMKLFKKQEKVVFTSTHCDDIPTAMRLAAEKCAELGLPDITEMQVTNLVVHHESGIVNPEFSEASVFDTRRRDTLLKTIAELEWCIERRRGGSMR